METESVGKVKSSIFLPISILVAGVLISGALIYNAGIKKVGDGGGDGNQPPVAGGSADKVKEVTAADHLRGDLKAPVKMITFEDTECPFCKRFHPTLQQIMKEYNGKVAWVYRHFPLDQIHSKARKEAEATECAAELGGNEKFWAYLDRIFEVTPSNDGLDLAELPKIAKYIGLDQAQFEKCLASGKYAKKVADDLADAMASGGNGTPHTVIIGRDGKKYGVSGALPYEQFKLAVEQALR